MGFFEKIKGSVFVRNIILAVCAFIVIIFLVQLSLNFITRHGQVLEVPDFSGVTMEEALKVAGKSYRFEINDSLYLPERRPGIVLDQIPKPGSKVKSGRRIFITVNSFQPRKAEIPYVTGFSLRQAKNNIDVAGFEVDRLEYVPDIAVNNVLRQVYDGRVITADSKTEAPVGAGITLVVGGDSVPVRVPKVIGVPFRSAKNRLIEQGFNIGKIVEDEGITEANITEARVYRQEPQMDSRRYLGTPVDIYLTLDVELVNKGAKDAERQVQEAKKKAEEEAQVLKSIVDSLAQTVVLED